MVSDANLEVDDYWTGPAAEAYKSAVQWQTEAMGEVMAIADEVKDHLLKIAAAIGAFYVALGAAIIRLVKHLRTATAAVAGTTLGAILSAMLTIETLKKTWKQITALTTAASGVMWAEAEAFFKLRGRVQMSDKFPRGHWPKATTRAMRDGSLQDGDETDWHTKAQ